MRKALALVFVLFCSIGAVVAESGLFITPMAGIDLGVNNYFRGGSVGAQVMYDLGGVGVGLETRIGYDMAFNDGQVPLFLILSLGPFYVMAGQTFGIGDPWLAGGNGTKWLYQFSAPLNTYGLGFKLVKLDTAFGKLVFGSEAFYMATMPVSSGDPGLGAFGMLGSFFLGLKAEAYGAIELNI